MLIPGGSGGGGGNSSNINVAGGNASENEVFLSNLRVCTLFSFICT